ncbi:MAG: hypothetical protein DRP59_10475 [Spirochaetes bacterium]|nr:MAG: hypothetical protein DRP59_10475 [Spirochaetota bacterium]
MKTGCKFLIFPHKNNTRYNRRTPDIALIEIVSNMQGESLIRISKFTIQKAVFPKGPGALYCPVFVEHAWPQPPTSQV